MKKEIVFIDEETLTKDEMQNAEQYETAENRMKKYHDKMEEMNGKTEEQGRASCRTCGNICQYTGGKRSFLA